MGLRRSEAISSSRHRKWPRIGPAACTAPSHQGSAVDCLALSSTGPAHAVALRVDRPDLVDSRVLSMHRWCGRTRKVGAWEPSPTRATRPGREVRVDPTLCRLAFTPCTSCRDNERMTARVRKARPDGINRRQPPRSTHSRRIAFCFPACNGTVCVECLHGASTAFAFRRSARPNSPRGPSPTTRRGSATCAMPAQ